MRFIQIIMTIVIMVFAVWISAIMFGPWAIMKYAENKFGDHVKLHNVTVTSKLDAKINRIDFNQDYLKSSSIRGVDVRWSLLSGKPKLMIDVSSANFEDQYLSSDIYVEINKSDNTNNYPLAINAVAERLEALGSVNISKAEAEFLTNLEFSEFRNFKSTSGNLEMTGPIDLQSDRLQIEANLVRLNIDEQTNSDEIFINFDNVKSSNLDTRADKIIGKIIANEKFAEFDLQATNTQAGEDIFSSEKISVRGKFDIKSNKIVEDNLIELEQAQLLGRKIIKSKSQIGLNEVNVTILSEGILEDNEISLGGKYIGSLPYSQFNLTLKSEASESLTELDVTLDLQVQSNPEVDISIKSASYIESSNVIDDCLNSKCNLKDISFDYSIQSDGYQMSGVSECSSIYCSSNSSDHTISTSDTNQFFQKMQQSGIFNPLILGLAYSQMLRGLPDGAGHKLSF